MSLAVNVEIESTDMAVRRCTQALIYYGATGCFIDIEWAKLNNIPMHPDSVRYMRSWKIKVLRVHVVIVSFSSNTV
jgi:hypothetical protein